MARLDNEHETRDLTVVVTLDIRTRYVKNSAVIYVVQQLIERGAKYLLNGRDIMTTLVNFRIEVKE